MTNRELAEIIYEDLNKRGAELGNASIGIICKTLNEQQVKNLNIPDVMKSNFSKEELINFAKYVWYEKSLKDTSKGLLKYFDEWIKMDKKKCS